MTNYNYSLSVYLDGPVKSKATTEGQVEGIDPREAILGAVGAVTDVLDESYGLLSPTITITRVGKGVFEGEVDTHGLGDIDVRVTEAVS